MKIRITKCTGEGPAFRTMTPGSIHKVLRIEQDELKGVRGFYVNAEGGELLIWTEECNIVEKGGDCGF